MGGLRRQLCLHSSTVLLPCAVSYAAIPTAAAAALAIAAAALTALTALAAAISTAAAAALALAALTALTALADAVAGAAWHHCLAGEFWHMHRSGIVTCSNS